MIIRELYLENFGRFSGKRLMLEPGINLIAGPNEAGKTTAAEFIRCMLFGMKRARGRGARKDDFGRYRPFDGGELMGGMSFICRGKTFRLNRIFPDSVQLFCVDDGEVLDVSRGDLSMLLGGLGEGLYQSTVCAGNGHTAVPSDLTGILNEYFINMESVREEQVDVRAAEKYLRDRQKRAEAEYRLILHRREEQERGRRQKLAYLEESIAVLEEKLEALREKEVQKGTVPLSESQRGTGPSSVFSGKTESRIGSRGRVAGMLAVALWAGAAVFLLFNRLFGALGLALGAVFLSVLELRRRRTEREAVRKEQRKKEEQNRKQEQELLEYRLRESHLREEIKERRREWENCREELEELSIPGEEEKERRLETEACEDAVERIRKAAGELAADWGGRLEREASVILSAVTRGRYAGLKLGEGEITVTDTRRVYTPDQLSTGTKEQIQTAVRLSAALLLEEEPMPFVFDDAFLAWDEERLLVLLDWLASCGRQVLLFTGRKREEELLQRNNLPYSKIVLDE